MQTVEPGGALGLHVDEPEVQDRLTVAFRAILIIPLALITIGMYIASFPVVVVGWCIALTTGSPPDWAVNFITGELGCSSRLSAYAYFLTDRYPPLSLGVDPEYPVEIAVEPGTVQRSQVLLRPLLLIPFGIAYLVVNLGTVILSPFVWFVVLVCQRAPRPVHDALVASLRYQLRCLAFLSMVSTTLPASLFGDVTKPVRRTRPATISAPQTAAPNRPGPTGPAFDPWNPMARPTNPKEPTLDPFGFRISAPAPGPAPATATAAIASEPSIHVAPATVTRLIAPDPWRLELSAAARGLLAAIVLVGGLGWVAESISLVGHPNAVAQEISATRTLNLDYSTLGENDGGFESSLIECKAAPGAFACMQSQEAAHAVQVAGFAREVAGLAEPATASADRADLVTNADQIASDWGVLAAAPSRRAYLASPALRDLKLLSAQTATDYLALSSALSTS